ncbi:hypothetical protein DRP07_00740 [Archaeoglobales archaeon]|nr:MAG: hypothetical protein DRP07_00740 [Archaeoglobales archaeon]
MRGWIVVFIIVALVYAAFQGYIPGVSQYVEPIKKQLESYVKSESFNPKVAHLRNYPVKITYTVSKVSEKGFFGTYTYDALILDFHNTGSESASFIVGGVAIVGEDGNTYKPSRLVLDSVTVYPDAKVTKIYPFNKFPKTGKLYVDIYSAEGFVVGWSGASAQLQKVETASMYFEK